MGDRANIAIEQGDGTRIWLYTHWAGYDLPKTLHAAIKRGTDRWDDTPYLARIIFCEMVKNSLDDLTGYGITTSMTDNEYPLLVVDPDKQVIRVEHAPDRTRDNACIGKTFTMEAFRDLKDVSWKVLDSL